MINGLGKYIVKQKKSPEQARGLSPGLTARSSVRLLLSGLGGKSPGRACLHIHLARRGKCHL
jgi:hypothetical protein